MRLIALVIVGLSMAPVVAADELNMGSVVKSIREGLAEQLGVSVQSVACPETRKSKAGDVFDCHARVEEVGRLTVAVTQKDDDGNIAWTVTKTEGLLDLAKLEAQIVEGLTAHSHGAEVEVSCGGQFRGIKVGETFECRGEDSSGEKIKVQVTVEDSDGNVHWKVVEDSTAL